VVVNGARLSISKLTAVGELEAQRVTSEMEADLSFKSLKMDGTTFEARSGTGRLSLDSRARLADLASARSPTSSSHSDRR